MNSLRAELLGADPNAVPEFTIMLPNGWTEHDATPASEKKLLDQAARRLRDEHRPDLNAQLRALTGRAFTGLRTANTEKIYMHTEAWTDDLVLPLTITASVRTSPTGGSLDQHVVDLIRTKGATALHDDERFVRWESRSDVSLGTATVGQRTVAYLTPFPAGARTHALQFTAVAVHPHGEGDLPLLDQMFLLTDAIVSTFAWKAA
ncbi:hypothetical protein [Glaciibacter psychrotolerans]|uniref:Uncharacterized protein n=1 Tax=Glaciibacter psychrotolerans TaxID=670054 RepID=A0A7Z0EG96_9MICO|nr:hypothetical protein [Leifsonia psychrotolerans]NYJ20953.1 hypothetical protein [Leifsonia psychrotolerans]